MHWFNPIAKATRVEQVFLGVNLLVFGIVSNWLTRMSSYIFLGGSTLSDEILGHPMIQSGGLPKRPFKAKLLDPT